jgi:hypothetical protein
MKSEETQNTKVVAHFVSFPQNFTSLNLEPVWKIYDQNTNSFQSVQKSVSRINCKSDLDLILLRVTRSTTCFLDHGCSLVDLSCLDRHQSLSLMSIPLLQKIRLVREMQRFAWEKKKALIFNLIRSINSSDFTTIKFIFRLFYGNYD